MNPWSFSIRIRPFNYREDLYENKLNMYISSSNSLAVLEPSFSKPSEIISVSWFTYQHYFWSLSHEDNHRYIEEYHNLPPLRNISKQTDVYTTLCAEFPSIAMEGKNISFLLYGKPETGKTFTWLGSKSDPGLLPRFTCDLFDLLTTYTERNDHTGFDKFKIDCTFVEVWNDECEDLLLVTNDHIPSYFITDHNKNLEIDNLESVRVFSPEEVIKLISDAFFLKSKNSKRLTNRREGAYFVFTISLSLMVNSGTYIKSNIRFIEMSEFPILHELYLNQEFNTNFNISTLNNITNDTLGVSQFLQVTKEISEMTDKTINTQAICDISIQNTSSIDIKNINLAMRYLVQLLYKNCITKVLITISPADSSFYETIAVLNTIEQFKGLSQRVEVNYQYSLESDYEVNPDSYNLNKNLIYVSEKESIENGYSSNTRQHISDIFRQIEQLENQTRTVQETVDKYQIQRKRKKCSTEFFI